jgi:hypothetical protein
MGGQVLGGGVIVLVAVLLWLIYLLPSWHSRHQYDAAERNAVRLNQALRVLAETSETPDEVRLELNARTALAQQRLARRALAERESAELERSRAELERARLERERARRERAAVVAAPAARQSRARRRVRLALVIVGVLALVAAVGGGWMVVQTGSQLLLWSAVATALVCFVLLRRMALVTARSASPAADAPLREDAAVQDVALGGDRTTWAPRELPRPLTASEGSAAAATLDAVEAREALRQAAVEEAMRQRAEALRPPSIDIARKPAATADDAEIEAHVRQLLARRAAGE